ncbi:MAG: hypothetical protein A4E19_04625 [Nitrospira sp. SG-bin1]|nr:MAG: hypothetical protein A4E19_04625 [Nitrospira sp. SG-bin1]
MNDQKKSYEDLVTENEELRAQLDEARDVLTAIRTGSVDALVVEGPKGEQIYSLQGADFPYRVFVEHMNEGAVTIDENGFIVYANHLFADLVGLPLEQIFGGQLSQFVAQADQSQWDDLIREANGEPSRRELAFVSASGESIPVLLSARHLPVEPGRFYCCIVSDLRRQHLHEQLRQSEERLRLATTAAAVGIWEWNVKTNRIRWDTQMFTIYGAAPTADGFVPYETWSHAVVPEELPVQEGILWETVRRCGSSTRRFRIRRYRDGEERHIEAVEIARTDAQGATEWVVGTNIDITERKQAEHQLLENHRFISEMTSVLPGILYIFDLQEQRNVYVNRHTGAVLGYSPEEAHTLGADFIATVLHPDDAIRLLQHFESFKDLENGVTAQVEYRLRHRDGSYRWFLSRDVVWQRTREGGVRQILGIGTDITERKRTEEALMASEQRFSKFMRNLPGLAWVKDAQGRYCYANEAAQHVFRRPAEDLYGKTDKELFSEETAEQFIMHDKEALSSSSGIQTVETLEHPDGIHFSLVTKFPIHRSGGEPPLVGGIGIDITDRVRSEQQLKASKEQLQLLTDKLEQLVKERTQELQHSQERLRALTSELNLAEQRERKRLATDLHDHLQQMLVVGKLAIGQGKRAASGVPACEIILKKVDDILSDALAYSRTLVAELSPPVLRDHGLVASLRWLAEYMEKKHDHRVTIEVPDDQELDLPEDQRILLFQSVRELLINSAKHAGTGQARLTMTRQAGRLCIAVKDEGKGFNLAAAAAAAAGDRPGGEMSSKFGLYSIRERMLALGGTFAVTSAPGQGTTATLVLPLARSAEESGLSCDALQLEAAPAARNKKDAGLQTGRKIVPVILVDDHAMVRQGLRSVLDAYADIQVVGEAGDGAEAVKLVEELRPRVVVMDINMPKMNGIEATEQITRRYPDTIVIGISVNATRENEEAMRAVGAVRLMTKEAAVEQLCDAILEAVKKEATG